MPGFISFFFFASLFYTLETRQWGDETTTTVLLVFSLLKHCHFRSAGLDKGPFFLKKKKHLEFGVSGKHPRPPAEGIFKKMCKSFWNDPVLCGCWNNRQKGIGRWWAKREKIEEYIWPVGSCDYMHIKLVVGLRPTFSRRRVLVISPVFVFVCQENVRVRKRKEKKQHWNGVAYIYASLYVMATVLGPSTCLLTCLRVTRPP